MDNLNRYKQFGSYYPDDVLLHTCIIMYSFYLHKNPNKYEYKLCLMLLDNILFSKISILLEYKYIEQMKKTIII